jgi:ribosomal protein S18 acetylase RimI-like enzyme
MMTNLLREYIKELITEGVSFHELDSPLSYPRAYRDNVKRLAYCDSSVTEPPKHHDAYFVDYQKMIRFGKRGQRLKKPRKGEFIPGVSNVCIIGFLDYHADGKTSDGKQIWYIDYIKTRSDSRGKGVASKLIDEFFSRHVDPDGGIVQFGRMMREEIGHLKDKMAEKYPNVTITGAVYY